MSPLHLHSQIPQSALLLTAAAIPIAGWALHVRALHRRLGGDSLSGALRRPEFERRARRIIRRHQGEVLLCVVDLDYLKRINDNWGHEAGDAAVAATGARLVRWAGDGAVGRFGGDEMAAITWVPAASDPTVVARAQRHKLSELKRMLSEPVDTPTGPMPVGVSVGGASALHLGVTDLPDLLRGADVAMYRTKHQPFPGWAEQSDLRARRVNGRRKGRPGTALAVESQPA
ncbi:GGDEF domain-containing protein [Streptomyces albidoflavus]|uniref:GGDEF domain-containing protein n=1 Tax=Streptomyces albidoflavus TaxID=1886 RepID=UPI0033F45CD3